MRDVDNSYDTFKLCITYYQTRQVFYIIQVTRKIDEYNQGSHSSVIESL